MKQNRIHNRIHTHHRQQHRNAHSTHVQKRPLLLVLCVALLTACQIQWPGEIDPAQSPLGTPVSLPVAATLAGQVGTGAAGGYVAAVSSVFLPRDLAPYAAALRDPFVRDLQAFKDATRYDLNLTLMPDLLHVRGIERIRYTNRAAESLPELMLRLFPNTEYFGGDMRVTDTQVEGRRVTTTAFVRPTPVISTSASPPLTDTSVLRVPLLSSLPPGQSVVLTLTYELTVPAKTSAGYRTLGWSNDILGLPTIYALMPVRDTSGWRIDPVPTYGDVVYSEESLFRVRIHAPADVVIAATGVCNTSTGPGTVISPTPTVSLRQDLTCVAAPMRDFALSASRRYQVITTTVASASGPVMVSSYYMPQYKRGGASALTYAVQALGVYERRFGPYPFRELKVLASGNSAGGMEYPMLAAVTNGLYEQDGGYFEWITAHEVAHQWWYGIVGSDPIREPWLDESLTQYSASLYIEDRYGAQAAAAERERYFTTRYQHELNNGRDAMVAQPSGAFDRNAYAPIVYGKGPLFFEAVRRTIGDRLFDGWLRTYFNRFRYRNVQGSDLLGLADEMGFGSATRTAFDQWMRSVRQP
jgi:hypothetical protein